MEETQQNQYYYIHEGTATHDDLFPQGVYRVKLYLDLPNTANDQYLDQGWYEAY